MQDPHATPQVSDATGQGRPPAGGNAWKALGSDLKNPVWIYAKGFVFLGLGLLAAGILLLERATVQDTCLLVVAIWSFCRFYYFAFYVIEHYVDGAYKFAGLGSFIGYLISRRQPLPPSGASSRGTAPHDESAP